MIPLIITIVTFYALIPVIKTMDMKKQITISSLFRDIRNGFKASPDAEMLGFQGELARLTETLQEKRSILAGSILNEKEHEFHSMSLEETRNTMVRLVRKFEVDMSDEEYERVINLISSENDPAGTPTRIHKDVEVSSGAVRLIQPRPAI